MRSTTLTLREWIATLRYFSSKCAYCQDPYEACDHFIPLGMGVGSMQGNCVPSCYPCNLKKGKRHPDMVKTIGQAHLQRVRHYLFSLSRS